MKFTPNCTVSYHGEFHKGGVPFEIDEADADELSKLGEIERPVCNRAWNPEAADESTRERAGARIEEEEPPAAKSEEPVKLSAPTRRGRPRKAKGD